MLLFVGLVFDETKPADPTLQAPEPKPKVALAEDPKQSRVSDHTTIALVS